MVGGGFVRLVCLVVLTVGAAAIVAACQQLGETCLDDSGCARVEFACIGGLCDFACSDTLSSGPTVGSSCAEDQQCNSERCDNDDRFSSCECLAGTGGTGGSGGMGANGGNGGMGGSGGSLADVFADEVDDALTNINDADCLGDCIGEPANATGEPDPEGMGGNTTSVSLGPGGMLGLVFVDELCIVDGEESTPDIVVYEVGGVQREDFSLKVARPGEANLVDGEVVSSVSDDQPERHLDLTRLFDGPGVVERIQIIDIDGPPDEPEEPGFEEGWGADIDAVACFSR